MARLGLEPDQAVSFIPENPLEEALVRAVEKPATAQDFYRLLLDSDLLVIGTIEGAQAGTDGKFTAEPGSRFQLEPGEKNGVRFLPVFSALPRMQAYANRECPYLTMPGRALLEMTRGAPVILNPASDYGRELSVEQVAWLLNPVVPRAPLQDSYAEVALPPTLANALCEVFEARGDVAMAWMIQIRPQIGPVPVPVVGVETSADMPALMEDIAKIARIRVPGLVFDVQKVDRKNPVAFSEAMLKAKPFYPRSVRPN